MSKRKPLLHGIALAAGVLLGLAAGSSGQAPENIFAATLGESESRYVAEALAREAFHNVSYFQRSLEQALAALRP